MNSVNDDSFHRRIGTGGSKMPMEIVTHGQKRMEVDAAVPAMKVQPAAASPDAPLEVGSGTWFFRDNGAGKSQFCVRFPSGAVQVVATEP